MAKNLKNKYENKEVEVDSGIVYDLRNLTAKLMNISINMLENRIPKDIAEQILYDYAIELINLEEEFANIAKNKADKEKQ